MIGFTIGIASLTGIAPQETIPVDRIKHALSTKDVAAVRELTYVIEDGDDLTVGPVEPEAFFQKIEGCSVQPKTLSYRNTVVIDLACPARRVKASGCMTGDYELRVEYENYSRKFVLSGQRKDGVPGCGPFIPPARPAR